MDSLGQVYIYGETRSVDFPVTPNALYGEFVGYKCIFLSILNPEGQLAYSTFYSPLLNAQRYAGDLVVVEPGRIWISISDSDGRGDLPITPDALISETTGNGAGYFARLNLTTGVVEYASYLGAPHSGYEVEQLQRIIPVGLNRLLLLGWTDNSTFPMPPGGFNSGPPVDLDGYLLELQLPNQLLRGTFLGGAEWETASNIQVEPSGTILVVGLTMSADFPVTPDAFDSTLNEGPDYPVDVYICRFSADLATLVYGTFLGGEGEEVKSVLVYDSPNAIWLAGNTYSFYFPLTYDAMFPQPSGGFLLRMDLSSQSIDDPFIPHPSSFALSSFPNPFNPTATLSFTLPHSAPVTIGIYNVLGQTVYEEHLGRLNAGEHRQMFDASELPSGVYLARVQAGERSQIRKMVLLR